MKACGGGKYLPIRGTRTPTRVNNRPGGRTWPSKDGHARTASSTYAYGNADWPDLLTAYNGKSITYDAIGNPLSDGTWTYAWQHGRQLASMSKSGSITYGYNADGKRISKTVNGTTYNYSYLGDQLTEMTWGSNKLHFIRPCASSRPAARRRPHCVQTAKRSPVSDGAAFWPVWVYICFRKSQRLKTSFSL